MAEEPTMQDEALERATGVCQQALVDYQAGLMSEEQLREVLHRAGIVAPQAFDAATLRWYRNALAGLQPAPAADAASA